ncbi:WhiB family transcriptional regulator [Actinacidiphila sp. DG2A-62]|uniref:WhiB family transcriptional regulator n=1 Tax=Actinacidiphila sp. DG2A-62 TaxID=3108821 RepID=UPI002DBAF9A1|nr:WhiB family transcriptional regulator [Actinacidiphila sp. DG2A-62]MEC3996102.1 WhiB family transcriptional regulator [Actinacidiphila sp. DG2A-62]
MPSTPNTPARHRSLGDQTWQNRAACRPTEHHPVDPELFFPDPEEMDKIRAAKALCNQCPVRRTCLDAALENTDTHGIRGGLTEEERAPMHTRLPHRLDYSRVNAAVAGRDIHLTPAERQAVVHAAYRHGLSASRLAWILKIDEETAQKRYRETRRALRHQDLDRTTTASPPPEHGGHPLARDDFGTAA